MTVFTLTRAAALSAGIALGLCAAGAGAATMNFDALPDEGAQLASYSENGIKAKALGGVLAYFGNPGFAHIDDSGSGLATGADFTTGGTFDAVGFSLVSWGYNFWDIPDPLTDNIFVEGYLGNTLVASAGYVLSDVFGAVQNIILGQGFTGLTRLRISLAYPVNSAFCDAPCGHFDLDSVTLNPTGPAPVPLPATAPLLAGAGLALAAIARRVRRRN